VSSPTAVISVRGTVFEVVVEDEDGTTFVSVDEGLVGVRSKAVASAEVLLQPTQSIRVFKNQPLAQKVVDKGSIVRGVVRAIEDAARVALQRQGAGGGVGSTPTTSTGTGPSGDKGPPKGGGTTTGGTTGPAPPSAPPPPPPGG
jgi:hypothetical protein